MRTAALLLCALAALLLPPGWGAVSVVVGCAARAGTAACVGLLLLAAAAWVRAAALAEPAAVAPTIAAVRLQGRWRQPPGGPPYLSTDAGRVALEWPADLSPPSPGTALVVLARVQDSGGAQVAAVESQGEVSGAWLDRWAVAARRRVADLVSPARRGLVEALVLGRREDLPRALTVAARVSGTAHILSLSGLHVVLVAAIVRRLLGRTRPRPEAAILAAFVALAGAGPPLVRSLLGWLAAVSCDRGGRATPALHRLGAVALVAAVLQPRWIDDLGAQLSFLAVGGMLAAGRVLRGRAGGLLAPAGAFLATAPLVGEIFGEVAPWGLLVTPLVTPLVAAVLGLGLLLVVPGPAASCLDALGPALDGSAALLELAFFAAADLVPAPLPCTPPPIPGAAAGVLIVAALACLGRHGDGWPRW